MRRAAAPDLLTSGLEQVSEVKIVLAYNKDEDHTGIQLYERQTNALGTKIGDNVRLTFERWNLTTLTEKVKERLLTPALLPQRFFSLFGYICSQFADFRHGSEDWTHQLAPNWRRFLADLLAEQADERTLRLLPVALIVLREQGSANPSAETGWIDMTEWAMLAAWRVYQTTKNQAVRLAVLQMWVELYLTELERYYETHSSELAAQDALEVNYTGNYVDAVAAAVVAFWHVGRLGLLSLATTEFQPHQDVQKEQCEQAMRKGTNWLASLLNRNPAAFRPLIDLHHIELFLIWRAFWQLRRLTDMATWLHGLHGYLMVRRAGAVPLPFLEGGNSLNTVFEAVATEEKPPEYCDQSSMLLLCILEFCLSLTPPERDRLIELYYQQLVLGKDSEGQPLGDVEPIELMGWVPPEDWGQKVLIQGLAQQGESLSFETLGPEAMRDGATIASHIEEFIRKSRNARKTVFPEDLPDSVIVLACLKQRSPLPAELWRSRIFGPMPEEARP